jgi:hypothetical protein
MGVHSLLRIGTSFVTGSGVMLIFAFVFCLRHLINTTPQRTFSNFFPQLLTKSSIAFTMSAEEEQYEEGGMSAPGAPTPVNALEVRVTSCDLHIYTTDFHL